jgi:tetratricopeptide (TPR) repeat protein
LFRHGVCSYEHSPENRNWQGLPKRANVFDVKIAVRVFLFVISAGPAIFAGEIQKSSAQPDDTVWLEARALCRRADSLSEEDARPVYQEAYAKAREAVVVSPQSAGAHYFLGLSAAKIARGAGPFSSLKYIHVAQREMEKVIGLDPGFSDAGAYRVLGKIDLEMPGALGGRNKRSREYLEKAVALAPGNALNHLYLAQALKALGDKKRARAEAFRVTVMPSEEDPSRASSPQKEAQKLLESLGHSRPNKT